MMTRLRGKGRDQEIIRPGENGQGQEMTRPRENGHGQEMTQSLHCVKDPDHATQMMMNGENDPDPEMTPTRPRERDQDQGMMIRVIQVIQMTMVFRLLSENDRGLGTPRPRGMLLLGQ